MERFSAIKNYKSASKIQSLCRLCGMDNAGKMLICENDDDLVVNLDDDDVSLQRKIEICTGIFVQPNDHLPQYCCGICGDKICDFYEFRLMCTSTEIQTRRILGLPPRQMPDLKPQLKFEPETPGVLASVGQRGRSFVQPKIKLEDQPMLMEIEPPPDVIEAERRQAKRRKEPVSNREELLPTIQLKRLKVEKHEIVCTICKANFPTESDLFGHMYVKHVPTHSKYGCSSCGFALEQQQDWKRHISWHAKNKRLYVCPRCQAEFDKSVQYSKHFLLNKCRTPRPITQPDIHCELCRKKFATRNLYQWHNCFIRNKANCRKCGQYFAKKVKLFDHFLKCPLPFIDLPPPAQKSVPEKSKIRNTSRKFAAENSSNVRTNDYDPVLDISTLLETDINQTAEEPGGLEKINSLLNSVTDAIAMISSAKSKKKKRKEKEAEREREMKYEPIRLRIKTEKGTSESPVTAEFSSRIFETSDTHVNENEDEDHYDDISYIPQEEHFAEVDSDDDAESSVPSTIVASSGTTTPAIRIKQERLDAGYGDHVEHEEDTNLEFDDIVRRIKQEPGLEKTRTKSTVTSQRSSSSKSSSVKPQKAINPLAVKKVTNKINKHSLILKIKKERSEKETVNEQQSDSNEKPDDTTDTSVPEANPPEHEHPDENAEEASAVTGSKATKTKAINPLAAGVVKKTKSKLLKVPRQLALKIKKERSEKAKKQLTAPVLRIKQEKPDSEEEHAQPPPESEYLALNPLSLFREKQAKKSQNKKKTNNNEKFLNDGKYTESDETENTPETVEKELLDEVRDGENDSNDTMLESENDQNSKPETNKEFTITDDIETETRSKEDVPEVVEVSNNLTEKQDKPISPSPPVEAVIPGIFEAKTKTGFVMLKGNADGPGLIFSNLAAKLEDKIESKCETTVQTTSASEVSNKTNARQETSLTSVPKTSTFLKISGNSLGDFQLRFPGIASKPHHENKPENQVSSINVEDLNSSTETLLTKTTEKPPTPPPTTETKSSPATSIPQSSTKPFIIPGLGSGFTKLSALSFPPMHDCTNPSQMNSSHMSTALKNDMESPTFFSATTNHTQKNVASTPNIDTSKLSKITDTENDKVNPELDIDTGDLDLDDLLNEKINSLDTNNEKTVDEDDLLREIEKQLESKS